jgi:hypothetical protein
MVRRAPLVCTLASALLVASLGSSSGGSAASLSLTNATLGRAPQGARTLYEALAYCDTCDSSPNGLCHSGTNDACDVDPCDEGNEHLKGRGWYCLPNSATVVAHSRATLPFLQPAAPRSATGGRSLIIGDGMWYACQPCQDASQAGQWCFPGQSTVCQKCSPCPSTPEYPRGLLCYLPRQKPWQDRAYMQVCVNGNGAALHDVNQHVFSTADGKARLFLTQGPLASTAPQRDTSSAIWGLIITFVVVTAGVVAIVASDGAAASALPEILDSVSSSVESIESSALSSLSEAEGHSMVSLLNQVNHDIYQDMLTQAIELGDNGVLNVPGIQSVIPNIGRRLRHSPPPRELGASVAIHPGSTATLTGAFKKVMFI